MKPNIRIERIGGKEIRWINGVPYSRPRPKYVDLWETCRKENWILIIDCPDCEGTGEREVQADAREFTVTPEYKDIKCELCDGVGEIENID